MNNFVTYELAVKLKEKGFKEKCIAYYWEKINEHTPSFLVEDNMPEDGLNILDLLSNHNQAEWSPFIDAPTIPQVLKWLREEKGIHIELIATTTFATKNNTAYFVLIKHKITATSMDSIDLLEMYALFNDACIAGIEYVLDNLI